MNKKKTGAGLWTGLEIVGVSWPAYVDENLLGYVSGAQCNGKRYGDTLKLDADIHNISGAILSCKCLIEGVRRILALYQTVLR